MEKQLLQTLDYEHVTLMDSPFLEQFRKMEDVYENLDNDSLLYNFRKRAGKTTPGRPLNGWYGRQSFNFGQFCGALAKIYRQTGKGEVKEKLFYLLEEWGACIEGDGYGFSPQKARYQEYIIAYEYEKLAGGLVDAWEYAGYPKAFFFLEKITDWFIAHSPSRDKNKLYLVEWYTIPENLYRAWWLSKNEKFKNAAERFEYMAFWENFLKEKFQTDKTKHAYSHVNSLCSAAQAYLVKEDEKYLAILKNAYQEITGRHIYSTGGYGPQEDMFGKDGYMGDSLKSAWDNTLTDALVRVRHDAQGSCEVSCCTWAAFKLCRYLMCLTGDARYGAWAEKLLYNGVLSLPPVTKDGKIMYYANYFLDGGIKSNLDRRYHGAPEAYDDLNVTYHYSWQCCTGTYPQAVAEYVNMIYFIRGGDLYVSQYMPSMLKEEVGGTQMTLTCKTRYPEEETVYYCISCESPAERTIYFRIPAWVKESPAVYVNGVKQTVEGRPGEWMPVSKTWRDQDTIMVKIGMPLYFEKIDNKNKDIVSLLYGPVVLVSDDLAAFCEDPDHVEEWIERVPGERLKFRTKPGAMEGIYDFETRDFVPYWSYPEGKWYFLYFWLH